MVRRACLLAMLLALSASVAAAAAVTTATATVGCGDVIAQQRSGSLDGGRVVLGLVAVPPARIPRGQRSGIAGWKYFSKWGLEIHRGTAVTVSVAADWRARAAITWGASTPRVSSLRFRACRLPGSERRPWSAYPGGFFLDAPTACVPLRISVGRRARSVRFGIGRSC